MHSKYFHFPWTYFAQILNAGSWRQKLIENEDGHTEKNEDDPTRKMKTTSSKKSPNNYKMTKTHNILTIF